jgi:hypothetical protein
MKDYTITGKKFPEFRDFKDIFGNATFNTYSLIINSSTFFSWFFILSSFSSFNKG